MTGFLEGVNERHSKITIARVYEVYEGSALAEASMSNVSPATGGNLKVEAHTDFAISLDGETRTVLIDDEQITYTDVDEATDELVNITRGANSTVAAAHDPGAFVYASPDQKREKFADGFIDDDDALAVGVEIRRHLWNFYATGTREHDEMEVASVHYLSDDHPIVVDAPDDRDVAIGLPMVVPVWSTTGEAEVGIYPHRFPSPISGTVEEYMAVTELGGAPTGDDLILDLVKDDDSSILTTKLTILDGEIDGTPVEPTTKEITKLEALRVEVEQVGSTTPGSKITVYAVIWPTSNAIPPRIEVRGLQGDPGTNGADGLISEVQNEGTPVTDAPVMDFTGSGVDVTSDGSVITVDVSGGGSGGGLLGMTQYDPGSEEDKSTSSTSFVDVDATNLTVTFDAPASGEVIIELHATGYHTSGSGTSRWGVYVNGSDFGNSMPFYSNNATEVGSVRIVVTGLTPATSYTAVWRYKAVTAGTAHIRCSSTHTFAGPATMIVMAI